VAQVVLDTLSKVVSEGTARRLFESFKYSDGTPLALGGKTGTGDNRIVASVGGQKTAGKALSRTATFVFHLGNHHFGTLTAFVTGSSAHEFSFTSALPLQVLKGMVPILQPYLLAASRR
jgi:hypothetical protein